MSSLNRSVVSVAYDGLCLFEFGVVSELFGLDRPELEVEWYDYTVVSVDERPIRAIGGVSLQADTDLQTIERAGLVVLPGWRDPAETPPDALLDALRVAHRNGARLMSICSGVFVLAAAGLLNGHAATTHWRYTDHLQAMYPQIRLQPDVLYVDNGQILTSAGSAAGIDLGLHLIRRDHGVAVANEVARRLVVPRLRDGGQAQFIARTEVLSTDTALAATMAWAEERLDQALTIGELAAQAHMSERTFVRRFTEALGASPHRWLTGQRIARSRELLETTDLGIEAIAHLTGLGSAENLRRHFRRETHTTPSNYRAAFQSAPRDHGAG